MSRPRSGVGKDSRSENASYTLFTFMHIREYTASDLESLRRLHSAQRNAISIS